MSAYNLDPRVQLTEGCYAVTCFDGSVGRVKTDGPEDVAVLIFEDGSKERHETADVAISTLIGGPQR